MLVMVSVVCCVGFAPKVFAQLGLPANFYETFIDQGFDALEAGNPQAAEGAFKQAIALRGRDAEATCYLGLAYYKMGNYVAALEFFEKAMVLDPLIADSPVLFYRAMSLRLIGLRGMERRAWVDLIRHDPRGRFALKGHNAIAKLDGAPSVFNADEVWRQMFKPITGTPIQAWKEYPHVAVLFYMESVFAKQALGKGDILNPLSNLLHGLNLTGRPDQVVEWEQSLPANIPAPIFLDLAIARVSVGNCVEADLYLKKVEQTEFRGQGRQIQMICDQVHDQYKQQISIEGANFRLYNYNEGMHRDLTRQAIIPDGSVR